MPAYLIVRASVSDSAAYESYKRLAQRAVQRFEGRYLVRGGDSVTLEGAEEQRRVVVIEFPSMERARAFYDSAEYQEARSYRVGAAEAQFIIVEGC